MIGILCGPIHSSVSHGGRGVGRGGKIIWPGGWQGRTMSLFFYFAWCVLGVLSGYSIHFGVYLLYLVVCTCLLGGTLYIFVATMCTSLTCPVCTPEILCVYVMYFIF